MKIMKKMLPVILIGAALLLCSPTRISAQQTVVIGHKRVVIPGYVEPNTPGAPGVTVDPKVAAAITDPAARNSDGTLNLNKAIYVRFFDQNRHTAPKAIVVLVPEKSSGAGSLRLIAKEIVRQSGGGYEAWVIDHQSNLLEDIGPMVTAENANTVAASFNALRAYQSDPAGRGGFLANNPSLLSGPLSEWGLDVFVRDIRAVVDEARKVSSVYLGGHAQGSNIVQAFAGYDFGDTSGYKLINGLILVDGTADPVTATPISDDVYLNGGDGVSGLTQLRSASVP